MPHVYLEVIKGVEKGRRYRIVDGANSIGRNQDNQIALASRERSVSGHHAILYKSQQSIMIQDLQSTNGLYVDENRVAEKELKEGAVLGFGKRGPRLSLVLSEIELDCDNQQGLFPGATATSESTKRYQTSENPLETPAATGPQPVKPSSAEEEGPLSNASFQGGSSYGDDKPLSNALFQGGSSYDDDKPLSNALFQGGSSYDDDKPLSNALFQGGSSYDDDKPLSNASFQGGSSYGDDQPLSNASFQGGSSYDDDKPLSNASFQGGSSYGDDKPLSNASFQGGSSYDDDKPLSNASFQGGSSFGDDKPLSNASFQGGSSFGDDQPLSNASFQVESPYDDGKPLSNTSINGGSFAGNGSESSYDKKSQSGEPNSFSSGMSDISSDSQFFTDKFRSAGVGDIKIIDNESGLSGDMAPPTSTMAVEQKFIDKNINADDIHDLMKNEGRLNRLVDRGNLGQTQANMLLSVHSAGKRMRNKSLIVLCCVIGIALVVISFFAVRAYQYKAMLDKGLTLEKKLDLYENQISKVNNNPDQNQEKLSQLLDEFEKTQTELNQVKTELREDDYEKFYDDPLEEAIDKIMYRFGESNYHIPPQMVERVRYHISIYSGRMKRTIGRYLKRKEMYFPMIEKVFKEKNLPVELAYVSMLESGFNPKALSHAGARGLWQFMPRTGRAYGLIVNDQIDERLDPEKATYSAAEYFRDLIAIFGGRRSVMLAMAAYNAGEGRIMGALKKIDDPLRDRDFWYIYRMGYLAEETNEYIPRIIALMIIDENAAKYGFEGSGIINESDLENESDFMEVNFGKYKN